MSRTQKCHREDCHNAVARRARFCSNRCQLEHQYQTYITRWMAGEIEGTTTSFDKPSSHIRRYLMSIGGERCSACHWSERNPRTGRVPLHVDHINGDAKNNRPENLRLLCPNCHSLTETFGKCNVGRGRPGRRARYVKGLTVSFLMY